MKTAVSEVFPLKVYLFSISYHNIEEKFSKLFMILSLAFSTTFHKQYDCCVLITGNSPSQSTRRCSHRTGKGHQKIEESSRESIKGIVDS